MIITFILGIVLIFIILFIYCLIKISSEASKKEEHYE